MKDERWRSAGPGFEPGRAGPRLSLTSSQDGAHVRDARSNDNERLVSNDIELSRVWGPCSYRLTIPLVLDAAYACTRGSIRAGRREKNFGGCDAVTQ
jgi:hypothetical protein